MSDNHRNSIYTSGYCFHNSNSRYEYRAITSSLLYLSACTEYEENYKIAICRDFYQKSALSLSSILPLLGTTTDFYIVPQSFVLPFSLLRHKMLVQSYPFHLRNSCEKKLKITKSEGKTAKSTIYFSILLY